jgi:hypothetical protein
MGLAKDLIGLSLALIAFFNPFSLHFIVRIILFLIGFDLMSFIPKFGLFLFDYFIGFSGLGILLIFLVFVDILAKIILKLINLFLKPIIIFLLIYFLFPDLAISIFGATLNFLINLASLIKL